MINGGDIKKQASYVEVWVRLWDAAFQSQSELASVRWPPYFRQSDGSASLQPRPE